MLYSNSHLGGASGFRGGIHSSIELLGSIHSFVQRFYFRMNGLRTARICVIDWISSSGSRKQIQLESVLRLAWGVEDLEMIEEDSAPSRKDVNGAPEIVPWSFLGTSLCVIDHWAASMCTGPAIRGFSCP